MQDSQGAGGYLRSDGTAKKSAPALNRSLSLHCGFMLTQAGSLDEQPVDIRFEGFEFYWLALMAVESCS